MSTILHSLVLVLPLPPLAPPIPPTPALPLWLLAMKLLIILCVRREGSPGVEYEVSARNKPPEMLAPLEVAEITGGAETAMVIQSQTVGLRALCSRPVSSRSARTRSLTLSRSLWRALLSPNCYQVYRSQSHTLTVTHHPRNSE